MPRPKVSSQPGGNAVASGSASVHAAKKPRLDGAVGASSSRKQAPVMAAGDGATAAPAGDSASTKGKRKRSPAAVKARKARGRLFQHRKTKEAQEARQKAREEVYIGDIVADATKLQFDLDPMSTERRNELYAELREVKTSIATASLPHQTTSFLSNLKQADGPAFRVDSPTAGKVVNGPLPDVLPRVHELMGERYTYIGLGTDK